MKKKYNNDMIYWAGTESSLEDYLSSVEKFSSVSPEAYGYSEAEAESLPELLSIQECVALVDIKGTLTNKDNWWNEYAGLVSYNAIREAMMHALASEEVKEIILDISSPGGTTYGLMDIVQFMKSANSIKKITAFSDSMAASAAYWLASAASQRVGTPDSHWGSIGIILSHVEQSKALKDAGYTPTIIRGGKYKALGHPSEPLSSLAKEELQGGVDYLYSLFVQSVADNLGNSYQHVDSKMAQGREFIGAQAKDVGLVDVVGSFDELFNNILKTANAGGNDMKKKYALTATSVAAIAAGVAAGEVEEEVVEVEASEEVIEAPTAENVTPEPGASEEASEEASAENVIPEPTASEVVIENKLLAAQVDKLQGKLLDAQMNLKSVENAIAKNEENMNALCSIASKTIGNMEIALGGSVTDHSKTEAAALVMAHSTILKSFTSKFKVGGVSATSSNVEEKVGSAEKITYIDRAKIKSVGLG